jgi:hypothetical protein
MHAGGQRLCNGCATFAAHQQLSSPKGQKRFISAPIAALIQSYRVEEILIIGLIEIGGEMATDHGYAI